tara:strand:- start:3168 stop:3455 length:288 start_codon:yes stop_codon:yes gene_type:complete
MADTVICPHIDTTNYVSKKPREQNEIIFNSLKKKLNKNCPNSIPKTLDISNKVLDNIKILNKHFKNKINFKIYILISLIIFILITSGCLYKLFNQ